MNQTYTQETINAMAMARALHYQPSLATMLYQQLGSATAVIEQGNNIDDVLPEATPRLKELLSHIGEQREVVDKELEFCDTHSIQILTMGDADYPQRLLECDDAPVVLYYRGSTPLNAMHVVSVVGTRRCTPYGEDFIHRLVADLSMSCPGLLVVSGLAYGVDVCAHRSALESKLPTVAVLAHGLDDLYPSRHRSVANAMVNAGGLLTEYMTHTNADKLNFVRRNRIVAGMADACVLIESAAHGGGLITAEIARDYGRDVFALPGRVGDTYSAGCNQLIRDNGAALLTSADDLIQAMGWQSDAQRQQAKERGIERELFPNLSEEERKIVEVLKGNNDIQVNILSVQAGIPIHRLSSLLFEMEMKGMVRPLAGGTYHLIG